VQKVPLKVVARLDEKGAIASAGPFELRSSLPKALGGLGGVELPAHPHLFLAGIANCCADILIYVAKRKGIAIDRRAVTATMEAELDVGALVEGRVPITLENMKITIEVKGVDPRTAEELAREAAEYCPLTITVLKPCKIEIKASTA